MTVINKTVSYHPYGNETNELAESLGLELRVCTVRGDWVNKHTGQISPYTNVSIEAVDANGIVVAHNSHYSMLMSDLRRFA